MEKQLKRNILLIKIVGADKVGNDYHFYLSIL